MRKKEGTDQEIIIGSGLGLGLGLVRIGSGMTSNKATYD